MGLGTACAAKDTQYLNRIGVLFARKGECAVAREGR